ncbi:MFS transporter [Streptomyces sp. SBT349]|uniref:MFS transporter n=1 Tax=Streptomyces sp. SBT349 TaxID=1580539 RepID=UPI00066EAFA7|nr:MFS transporter [Streptomyces sp. SBT349]
MRRYLATAFCARLADEGMAVAAVLLAIERTGSPAVGAFTLTAWMAPHVLAAPLAGSAVARARRPRLFHAAALACFAAAIAGLALTLGRAPAQVTLAVALAGGACGPVVTGGLSSLLGTLTPGANARARAYALDAATYNAAGIAGPAAVTVTAAALSPGAATALLACAAACAAALATLLPTPPGAAERTDGGAGRKRGSGAMAGLAALRHIRELRAITAVTCLACLGTGGLTVTAVLLAGERGQPAGGGLLMTAFAVGALGGSLALARRAPRLPPARIAGYGLLGTGAALAAAAAAPAFPACAALFVAAGACEGPVLGATLRIRAEYAPPGAEAHVFTLGAGLKITAAACGAALTGAATALPAPLLLTAIAAAHLAAAALLRALSPAPSGSRGPMPPRAP